MGASTPSAASTATITRDKVRAPAGAAAEAFDPLGQSSQCETLARAGRSGDGGQKRRLDLRGHAQLSERLKNLRRIEKVGAVGGVAEEYRLDRRLSFSGGRHSRGRRLCGDPRGQGQVELVARPKSARRAGAFTLGSDNRSSSPSARQPGPVNRRSYSMPGDDERKIDCELRPRVFRPRRSPQLGADRRIPEISEWAAALRNFVRPFQAAPSNIAIRRRDPTD